MQFLTLASVYGLCYKVMPYIRQTVWYKYDNTKISELTILTAMMIIFGISSAVLMIFIEKEWLFEHIANITRNAKIAGVYYIAAWLWIPMNVAPCICVAWELPYEDSPFVWLVGFLTYATILYIWASDNFFDDSLEFDYSFIDTERALVPSAVRAVDVGQGFLIVFSVDEEIAVDLRKCIVTLCGRNMLIIKCAAPDKIFVLMPDDYDCLKIIQIGGEVNEHRFYDGQRHKKKYHLQEESCTSDDRRC